MKNFRDWLIQLLWRVDHWCLRQLASGDPMNDIPDEYWTADEYED